MTPTFLRNAAWLMDNDLARLEQHVTIGVHRLATFEDGITRLTQDVAANQAAVGAVTALVGTLNGQVADLRAQVTQLQSAGVDTTALEAALTALEQTTATAQAALPPPDGGG